MSHSADRLRDRFYNSDPSWINGTERFGRIVRRYLSPEMVILNLGAGPGVGDLHFDADVSTVIGVDPDSAIAFNRRLSHRVCGVAEALPFGGEVFDLVYMDWVIEHLREPGQMAAEVRRVLKSGGRVLFRTPNLYHYSYTIARFAPHAFHKRLTALLKGHDGAEPYPTYYRMNTATTVRRVMAGAGFAEDELIMMEPDPAYLGMSGVTYLAGVAYERAVNRLDLLSPLRANILGCFRKVERTRQHRGI